ncbi:hypothetical protein [Allorhodopirellula solitaria]|uniref:Uncharacterized protein n=1 Tax=Allorhodopirellula solitaria TaxID=2527987 RepID=A0A5C5YK37_9BACT|nr:hypothetical protein [Allorhodopirellula solitaria]TWT75211.1 hypothetical protein CA85_05000 [Allorhodopirellula solitaria]
MITMRLRDPLLLLLGVRSSIVRVLRCPRAIWLALALVATAALAREYDAVSWLHHPRDLLAPFAASLLIGSIVFVFMMIGMFSIGRKTESLWRDYRVFMTGYWMTAPLAWLYAFPIETITDEVTALRWNLTMLSIVSVWRVLLFSRIVAIQFAVPMLAVLSWVLLPCMIIAFLALMAATLSMVSIMGGIRLTQTQQMLVDYQGAVAMICFYGVIPILVLGLVAIGMLRGEHDSQQEIGRLNGRIHRRVWWLPVAATCCLIAAAFQFQPGLYRATEVDSMLRRGQVAEAIEQMRQHGEDAFPVVWDPPPRFPDRDSQLPLIDDLMEAIEQTQCPRWIIDRLLVQADEIALRQEGWHQGTRDLDYLQRQFFSAGNERVRRTIVRLRKLQELEVGDDETIAHRTALLEALEAKFEENLEESGEEERERPAASPDVGPDTSLETAGWRIGERRKLPACDFCPIAS